MDEESGVEMGQVPVRKGLFPWPLARTEIPPLLGSRCRGCSRSFFPRRERCPFCQDKGRMEEVPLSREGRLYTYAIVRQGPAGFDPPYTTALVDLPEGVRIFARMTTVDPRDLRLDGPVALTYGPIGRDREGNVIISYLFRPLKKENAP